MRTNKYIFGLITLLGLASCDTEAPFDNGATEGEGQFYTAALNLSLDIDETVKVRSRAANDDLLPDFDIYFLNSSGQSVAQYKYGEMPEVVTLKQGKYKVRASYGQDVAAQWNNPYIVGESSSEFEINANKITTNIEPVVCSLKNVMVSIKFDSSLTEHISGEPEVEVYVNKESPLTFKKMHYDNGTPGYFGHYEVCTLTATFTGVVDGVELKEVKTLSGVAPGNHYRITFYRHEYVGDESGFIEGKIQLDAKVIVNNISSEIEVPEESVLEDVTWPTEDDENPGEGDDQPGEGDDNPGDETDNGPEAKLNLEKSTITSLNAVVTEDSKVVLDIFSKTGLTQFRVDVESEKLRLSDINIDEGYIDLINPGKYLDTYQQLGLIPKGKDSLRGDTEATFDISSLLGLLCSLGPCEHKFILTLEDEVALNIVEVILTVTE